MPIDPSALQVAGAESAGEPVPEGIEMVQINIPKDMLTAVTQSLTQLSEILNAANEKATGDIDAQNQEEGAGTPPPVGGSSLAGMGEELDAMRRSRGA